MWVRWGKIFADSKVGTVAFCQNLKQYLSAGLGLKELCGIVNFGEDGEPRYGDFVKAVMDSKLHIKEKNTKDCLDIDPESEQPYSIWSLLAGFAFMSAHNYKVDRYIPIDEIRASLKAGIGDRYDVDRYIDQYLEKEAAAPEVDLSKEGLSEDGFKEMAHADISEVFQQVMDSAVDKAEERHGRYDIVDYEDLVRYRKGSTVEPGLMESLGNLFRSYHGVLDGQQYRDLMEGTHEERCIFNGAEPVYTAS